jgi:hypothetical protein
MKKSFVSLCALVITLLIAIPTDAQQRAAAPTAAKKPATPAPKRDISGVWLGTGAVPKKEPVPPMTPWGQKFFDAAKPLQGPRALPIAKTNDPLVTCDPLGFPRSILYETRSVAFEHVPRRTLELFQYQRVWRDIWTDGRKLPTNVGATKGATSDPRYYGYSVGQWVDDYTFVVNTTGFNEAAWADELGHPRSQDAKVEERYHRVDHDTLELTVTIDDPKAYTKPFVAMRQTLTWAPKQEFEEQLCIPSEAVDYRETFRAAGEDK